MLPANERCKVRGCNQPYVAAGCCADHYIKTTNAAHKRAKNSKLHFGSTRAIKALNASRKAKQ
jgi:hypothetical protein